MKAHEIIRGVLDLIDLIDNSADSDVDTVVSIDALDQQDDFYNDSLRRFKQIAGIIDNDDDCTYANEPNEKYGNIDTVTVDAGGGLNEPKHPSDIRGNSISLYPYYQDKSKV